GKGRRRAANAFRVGELTVSPLIGGHSKPPAMQVDFYSGHFLFLWGGIMIQPFVIVCFISFFNGSRVN
ncbi:hypothetical protein KW465_15320, partial [Vibrio fluvialis]|nr:hypothetical protein [Vibrio fluvialis]